MSDPVPLVGVLVGSPAEVPGAGGDRDADIPFDPNICPTQY